RHIRPAYPSKPGDEFRGDEIRRLATSGRAGLMPRLRALDPGACNADRCGHRAVRFRALGRPVRPALLAGGAGRTFELPRGALDVFVEATNALSRRNPFCVHYQVTRDADGSVAIRRDL